MTPNDEPQKPPMSTAEFLGRMRAAGRLREPSQFGGPVAIVGVPMPPPDPPTSGDSPGAPGTGPDEPKPLKLILGRPRLRPGESKEEAARRLAREMFGNLQPE